MPGRKSTGGLPPVVPAPPAARSPTPPSWWSTTTGPPTSLAPARLRFSCPEVSGCPGSAQFRYRRLYNMINQKTWCSITMSWKFAAFKKLSSLICLEEKNVLTIIKIIGASFKLWRVKFICLSVVPYMLCENW